MEIYLKELERGGGGGGVQAKPLIHVHVHVAPCQLYQCERYNYMVYFQVQC